MAGALYDERPYKEPCDPAMSRFLIVLGLLILLTGLLWPLLSKLGFGRLPGDIVIERDNVTFYFPVVSAIVISIALSALLTLVFWLINR
jgi:hypothetical protein